MRSGDPLDVVASTADPAFATDEEGRVTIWNRAAERLLGYDAARVLGRPCHEVVCGRDLFGNRYCGENCSLVQMVRRREAVHHFEMDVKKANGETIRASFSIVTVPGPRPSQFSLVHIFQQVSRGREADDLIHRILTGSSALALPAAAGGAAGAPGAAAYAAARPAALTQREIEVLRRMAEGESTRKIADSLFISTTTVRNHVQHILQKLEAHSKMEAVSLALRNRLI